MPNMGGFLCQNSSQAKIRRFHYFQESPIRKIKNHKKDASVFSSRFTFSRKWGILLVPDIKTHICVKGTDSESF